MKAAQNSHHATVSVSAVLVHYRGEPFLRTAVESCLRCEALEEVLIIDNEGLGTWLRNAFLEPRVRVIEMARNVGFGRAANVGLSLARAPAVLVMNQDTTVTNHTLTELVSVGVQSGAALVGPTLVDGGGNRRAFKTGYPSGLPPHNVTKPWQEEADWTPVPWVPGAAILFMPWGRDLRFDPRLFMYAEDEELCWRAWRDGKPVVVSHKALMFHHGGTASAALWKQREIEARIHWSRAKVAMRHGRARSSLRLSLRAVACWIKAQAGWS